MDLYSPWQQAWQRHFAEAGRVADLKRDQGAVASYIPALANVPPDQFGIAVANVSGDITFHGAAQEKFSIQSLSKVFMLTLACKTLGAALWQRVGQVPSTNPFNSLIELELEQGVPRNPFINAGALVVADCLFSRNLSMEGAVLTLMRRLADSDAMDYSRAVAESEFAHADRNVAAAYLMKSYRNFANPVPEVIRGYCSVCAIEASCIDLAKAGLFLANDGMCPRTGEQIVSGEVARQICALMLTTGTYEHSGKTAFTIGLPTKSGVGGGVLAVIPGQGAVCAWSPRLDSSGNSVRAMAALEYISHAASASVFGASPRHCVTAPADQFTTSSVIVEGIPTHL